MTIPTVNTDLIIMAELQCQGFEHAAFNAALLHTVRLAYPSREIVFCGEEDHLRCVRRELEDIPEGTQGVCFRPMRVPHKGLPRWKRIPLALSCCKALVDTMPAAALIFCSITNTSLLALKMAMRSRGVNLPVVAVLHGCLSDVTRPPAWRLWNYVIGLRHVLATRHPRNLRLVVLGDSILNNVKTLRLKGNPLWSAMDFVCLRRLHEAAVCDEPRPPDGPLRFGFLGAGAKGLDAYCRLVDEVAPQNAEARFEVVGFHSGPTRPMSRHMSAIPDHPLSREEFERLARQLTYVVWTGYPAHYALTASGTFVDGLTFLKPGIYLRNDYIEHYFERMGDIGYLCDSHEEMVATILNIISEFPSGRYEQQVANIRKGGSVFHPATVAPQLRRIVDSCLA